MWWGWEVPVHGDPPGTRDSTQKERPCVIYQNDAFSQSGAATYVVIPLTHDISRQSPTGLLVKAGTAGFKQDSVILCDQLFTLKEVYFTSRMAKLSAEIMVQIDNRVRFVLGLPT